MRLLHTKYLSIVNGSPFKPLLGFTLSEKVAVSSKVVPVEMLLLLEELQSNGFEFVANHHIRKNNKIQSRLLKTAKGVKSFLESEIINK